MIQLDLLDTSPRVLIACECSGTVRDAFLALGYDAWSCDLKPDEKRSNRHITGDARDIIHWGWDLLIVAHPPCTRLCNSGARWLTEPPPGRTLAEMWAELDDAAALFSDFLHAPIARIAIENPIIHRHAKERIRDYRPPAQSVQPWQFGHRAFKRTCFWLHNLPPLLETKRLAPPSPGTAAHKRWSSIHRHTGWGKGGEARAANRSRFFPGIAAAMADQWGAAAMADIRSMAA